MSENILYSKSDSIACVTLNRPDKLNTFTPPMWEELEQVLVQANADNEVRVIILRGSGRAFSAGADISGLGSYPSKAYSDRVRLDTMIRRWLRIWELPKPLIAQVHGYCMGLGSCIASFCDIIMISADAHVGVPNLPLGAGINEPIWGFFIGWRKAKEMAFVVGAHMTGEEAVTLGWANHAFPADQLEQETLKMAKQIAKIPPDILRMQKAAINKAMELQHFRTIAQYASEWDSISHFSDGVDEFRAMIKEKGVKGAIDYFKSTD